MFIQHNTFDIYLQCYDNTAQFQRAIMRIHKNLWKTISSHITLSSCELQRMSPYNDTDYSSTCLRDGAHIYYLPGLDIVTRAATLLGPRRIRISVRCQ